MPSFQFDYNKAHIQQEVVYYPMCGTSFTVFGKNNCDIRSKKKLVGGSFVCLHRPIHAAFLEYFVDGIDN